MKMDVSKNSGFSPQIIHFQRGVPLFKPSMLGAHPYFWKDPDADFALLSCLCQHVFLGNGSKKTPFHHCKEPFTKGDPYGTIKVEKSVAEVVSFRIFEASFGVNILCCVETKFHWNTPFSTSMIMGVHLRTFFFRKEKWSTDFGRIGVFSTSSLPVPFLATKKMAPKKGHCWKSSGKDHLAVWGCKVVFVGETFGVWNITRRGTWHN